MVVIASISVSFAALVAAGTLVLALIAGALIFLTAMGGGGTDRRIRRFTDANRTFSQRVDAAIDAHTSGRRPPRTR